MAHAAFSVLFLALLCSSSSSELATENGYRFYNSKSFAQLPSESLCGSQFSFSLQFAVSKNPFMLLSAHFPAAALVVNGAQRSLNLSLTSFDSETRNSRALMSFALAENHDFHSLKLELRSRRLSVAVNGRQDSVLLTSPTLVESRDVERASIYVGLPPPAVLQPWQRRLEQERIPDQSSGVHPTFQGVIRNVLGHRDCDCKQTEHLPLIAMKAVDTKRLESCLRRNPCSKQCLCLSKNRLPTCRCSLKPFCGEKKASVKMSTISFEHESPVGHFINDQFETSVHGKVKSFKDGKSGSALRLSNGGYLDLGPHYGCYGDLERCVNGLTIRMWLRPTDLKRKRAFILSSRSYDVFTDAPGLLNVFFKTRTRTWYSHESLRLKENIWQLLELAWSTKRGLTINIDGKRVKSVTHPTSIDTKLIDDARIYLGASSEMSGRKAGGFDVDELQFREEQPGRDGETVKEDKPVKTEVYEMEVNAKSQLRGWPESRVIGRPNNVSLTPTKNSGLELSAPKHQYVDLGQKIACQDGGCSNGFVARIWVFPVTIDKPYDLLFSSLIKVRLSKKSVDVEVLSGNQQWSVSVPPLMAGRWSLLEISLSHEVGLEVFVNTRRVTSAKTSQRTIPSINKDLRSYVGAGPNGQINDDANSAVRVARLEIWYSNINQLRRQDKLSALLDAGNLQRANEKPQAQEAVDEKGKSVDYLRFKGNYVRYNLNNLVQKTNDEESLRIEFSTTQPNGLLWYAIDGDESTYLYLRDGKLVYEYRINKKTLQQTHTVVEKLSIDPTGYSLYDGRRHTVDVSRYGRKLTLVIDSNRYNDQMEQIAHGLVRILVRNYIYLGGIKEPGKINTRNFEGRVYNARLRGNKNPTFELVRDINRFPHEKVGDSSVIVYENPPPPVPKPQIETVIITTRPGSAEFDEFSNILSPKPVPYSFNIPGGLIRLPTWQYPRYKSMEIQFVTYEPRGVLFYAGPGRDGHKDFVCVEIFDGHAFFVYNHDQRKHHVKLSEARVDNGQPHNVFFSIAKNGALKAKFDGRQVPLPNVQRPHMKLFRSYTYIGSLDSFNPENTRAPWSVWAREGFVGCVNYIRINNGGYADARKFQNQHSTRSKTIGFCNRPSQLFCDGENTCGVGTCHRRWYGWKTRSNFYCDCAATAKTKQATSPEENALEVRGAGCSEEAPVVGYDGDTRTIVSFMNEYYTHTDDISIRFKTQRYRGTIFTTKDLTRTITMTLYLRDGVLELNTNVYDSQVRQGSSKTYRVGRGMYSDNRWHTVYIQRRANFLRTWVDSESPQEVLFPETAADDYRMAIKHIYLGNYNGTFANFVGSLSNFYWNPYDFLNNPEIPEVYVVKTTGLRPTLPPLPTTPPNIPTEPLDPVTVTKSTVYITVKPKLQVDFKAGRDTTMRIIFRTTEPYGLLFYLKGENDLYIAAELKNGKLDYSFNLGDGYKKVRLPFMTDLNDGRWHQIFVHLSSLGAHNVWIDNRKTALQSILKKVKQKFRLYLGGVPSEMWDSLPYTVEGQRKTGFVGCLSSVVFSNSDNLLAGNNFEVHPSSEVTVGQCRERQVCTRSYCKNGGRCIEAGYDKLTCDCVNTGFRGPKCEERIPPPKCPANYCANGGMCAMINKQPYCDCRGTGFEGKRCEIKSRCPPGYCKNGGACTVQYTNTYVCDCSRTGWTGQFCADKPAGIKIDYGTPGYVIYRIVPPKPYTEEKISFGFQTWGKKGSLATFMTPDGKYWSVVMRDGQLYLRLRDGLEYRLSSRAYNDGQYHVVNLDRNKDFLSVVVDGNRIAGSRFINIANPSDGSLMYSKVVVGANDKLQDNFKGAVGGFNWNGNYPLVKIPNDNIKGKVEIVVTPIPNLPKPKPVPICTINYCGNGGICSVLGDRLTCDCSNTMYYGDRCTRQMYGVRIDKNGPGGYIYYSVPSVPPVIGGRGIHRIKLGMQTWNLDGPIIRFEGKNNVYWQLLLRDGYVDVNVNGETKILNRGYQRLNNGNLQNIFLELDGSFLRILINGNVVGTVELPASLRPENYHTVVMGGDRMMKNSIRGILGGFTWNGRRLFNDRGQLIAAAKKGDGSVIVTIPQILPRPPPTTRAPLKPLPAQIPDTGAHGGLVWSPASEVIDGGGPGVLVPGPSGNSLKGGAIGGGAVVMAGAGPVVAGASFLSGIGAINPLIAGLLLAALLFLSAMLWACWRCKPGWLPCCAGGAGAAKAGYARVPALFGSSVRSFFTGKSASAMTAGAGGAAVTSGAVGAGGASTATRVNVIKVDAADAGGGVAAASTANGGIATTTTREMHTLNVHSSAASAAADNISVKSVPVGYAGQSSRFDYFRSDAASDAFGHSSAVGGYRGGGARLDLTPDRFGTMGSTYHMEAMGVAPSHNMSTMETTTLTTAAANTLGNNVFLNEEIKVDCCQISANSKYVVTGSSTGPPQVWDMKTGDLIKVMDGQEVGCTDLHLACGDSVLVAQVLDDIGATESMIGGDAGRRHRRLQLWDFATGRSMEMPADIMCTSTCVTWAGEHVVVARVEPSGPSILVWDLFANESAREIRYHSPAGLSPDTSITYLAVTPDDQLVVAGFVHSGDGQANYMVFDLDGPGGPHVPINPLHVTFDANLDCTELLATPHEAITGNRRGELFVWDLNTGKPLRNLNISAQLERAGTHNLPPHNGEIRALALSRDGQYLVTGSTDRMVKVWSMVDEKMILSLDGHTDDILTACISDDNEVVVSGSWDGSIRVWRMRDGTQMCWFTSNIEVFSVKVSHDKSAIVALGERGGHRKLIMLQIIRSRIRRTRPRLASAR